MATVAKDFKVKSGLIVEGATATVNNYDILTKKAEDQSYIVDLIGGTATPQNTADSVVKRDANGNFAAGTITADLQGDVTATTLTLNDGASNSSVYAGGSDLTVYGHNNLYLNTNNADIILQPDGYAKIYGDIIATQPYADQVAGNAQSAAQSYASGLVSQEATDRYTAITNAINAEVQDRNDAINTAASNTLTSANSYTDTKVSDLVASAPAMLDTLNELAAAIADNPNYASDVASLISTKADTTYVDSQINAAEGYTDLAISAEVTNRNDAIGSAVSSINATISGLATADISESVAGPLYFTDSRARNAVAGMLGGTQTNISVTFDTVTEQLSFVAENGVADSTTDDLDEGTSNLYFTNSRAVTALEAVVPNFTEIDLNDIVTKVATKLDVATASQVTAHEFDSSVYRSAEYTVKVAHGSHTELSKVMLTLDSSNNIAITEYAVVGTNGSASTITADVNAGMVRLRVTTANNASTVTTFGTIIK